jgi:hypothetical protein
VVSPSVVLLLSVGLAFDPVSASQPLSVPPVVQREQSEEIRKEIINCGNNKTTEIIKWGQRDFNVVRSMTYVHR